MKTILYICGVGLILIGFLFIIIDKEMLRGVADILLGGFFLYVRTRK